MLQLLVRLSRPQVARRLGGFSGSLGGLVQRESLRSFGGFGFRDEVLVSARFGQFWFQRH